MVQVRHQSVWKILTWSKSISSRTQLEKSIRKQMKEDDISRKDNEGFLRRLQFCFLCEFNGTRKAWIYESLVHNNEIFYQVHVKSINDISFSLKTDEICFTLLDFNNIKRRALEVLYFKKGCGSCKIEKISRVLSTY